jgi:periplasmic protein CpxP/Spy
MNTLAKKNLLLWSVIILILANIMMLATFFITRVQKAPHPSQTPAVFIEKELGFDESQKQKFDDLRKDHHNQSEEIRRKINEEEDTLFSLLPNSSASDSAKEQLIKQLAFNKSEIDRMTFDHFRKVREMCNPAQQKKFDVIIHDVIKMIAPQPPQRPPGPPGRPPLPPLPPGAGDKMGPPPPPQQ